MAYPAAHAGPGTWEHAVATGHRGDGTRRRLAAEGVAGGMAQRTGSPGEIAGNARGVGEAAAHSLLVVAVAAGRTHSLPVVVEAGPTNSRTGAAVRTGTCRASMGNDFLAGVAEVVEEAYRERDSSLVDCDLGACWEVREALTDTLLVPLLRQYHTVHRLASAFAFFAPAAWRLLSSASCSWSLELFSGRQCAA